ncbi:MAG: EF-P lysine aminoacylase EpmA [Hallerella porci]|uniref:Lysyl-tRNA synthetase class 2 n=1 Tax=Hallerella porci TaxID=1945871 RepID=A0ABX5LNE8_9BACT|nr:MULTISPECIES: EF-P lysine aminoacylase EpmA [Hallerella]MCI5601203.1 EF-P lysine aminoacylase EpmA [Hallerella sp.]MDY3920850.1 EF-P lysine aminoacylase EpmA [Hallerella porci]PWK98206.1 lysyl-tRNA synthetase class 2 [Hallerella porci]
MEFRPSCSRETWKNRLALTQKVRAFFQKRNVLEVETPVLSRASGTDAHLDYFETIGKPSRYLMTSPEFHLKRLLAADFGDIFEIAHAFRLDEVGRKHNSEFELVEWYRVGMHYEELMCEVEDLASEILGKMVKAERLSFREAYRRYAQVDPFTATREDFRQALKANQVPDVEGSDSFSREDFWDYLMVTVIEPHLGKDSPQFLMDYPESEAALAQTYLNANGDRVAKRFELYIQNMELCNGYEELTDPQEQRRRFEADIAWRKANGKPIPAIDERFLAALEHGMPAASGVAMGLDRLFMLALGKSKIEDVVLFMDDNS